VYVWLFLIFLISSVPYLPNPKIRATDFFEIRLDYVFHFGVYFILGFLVVMAKLSSELKLTATQLILILVLGSLFGSIDEVHQLIIPGRRYNPVDLFYNVTGLITGVVFTYYFLIRFLLLKKNCCPVLKESFYGHGEDKTPKQPV
jgi:VanZ family protein